MASHLKLLSFDFDSFTTSASSSLQLYCPNCGHQLSAGTKCLLSESFLSKTLLLIGCGSFLYWRYFKQHKAKSALSELNDTLHFYSTSLAAFLNDKQSSFVEKDSTTKLQVLRPLPTDHTSVTTTSLEYFTEQDWLSLEKNPDDSIDLPSLNSIGSSTVAKFDYLLDQVQQIKECIDYTHDELHDSDWSHQSHYSLVDRRLSESEITMPSLEWDLGDMATYYLDSQSQCDEDSAAQWRNKKKHFLYNVKHNGIIDSELLSQLIFNKDFDFKDRIYEDRINFRKHFASVRQQLKVSSSKQIYHKQCSTNLDSASYRSNRDSAFFE